MPCECCLCVFLNYKMGTKNKNPVCVWQLGQSRKANKSWYSELLAVLEALKSRSKRHPISWLLKWDVLLYFILFPGNTSHWMNVPHLDKSIPILPPPPFLCVTFILYTEFACNFSQFPWEASALLCLLRSVALFSLMKPVSAFRSSPVATNAFDTS